MILEPRKQIDQGLYAVIMENWFVSVSTRKDDSIGSAIGSDAGIPGSELSRMEGVPWWLQTAWPGWGAVGDLRCHLGQALEHQPTAASRAVGADED
jgi:hypothetical protein